MSLHYWTVFLLASLQFVNGYFEEASAAADSDLIHITCVDQCQKTGCIQGQCFQSCKYASDPKQSDSPWYFQELLYLRWKQWDCQSDCQYNCMLAREEERLKLGEKPIKYHGKGPFHRALGMQEPVSVALSTLNLAMQFQGCISFFILLYYKLPLRPDGKPYYEYTGLWYTYGFLSINSWFWSAVFHGRYMELTEKLYSSSIVVFQGYTLIISIIRALTIKAEAARVMVAAPLIAFTTTHLLFLHLVEFDYVLNMRVLLAIVTTRLLFWAIWAILSRHPSCWKVWLVVFGAILATLLEAYDYPPFKGLVDARSLCHAINIPLSYIWWSFIRDDAEICTFTLIKKAK